MGEPVKILAYWCASRLAAFLLMTTIAWAIAKVLGLSWWGFFATGVLMGFFIAPLARAVDDAIEPWRFR